MFGRTVQTGGRVAPDIREIRAEVGFVSQQFNLVDRLPVLTNVLVGALHREPRWRTLSGVFSRAERVAAQAALAEVGIGECAAQRADTLSGGQQQRAAISRALLQRARIILADEPIASLDPESARRVMSLLAEINRSRGVTVIVSLHQVDYAMQFCPRIVTLRAGEIVSDGPARSLTTASLRALYGAEAESFVPAAQGANVDHRPPGAPLYGAARAFAGAHA